jgi:hypothetical protein
VKKVFHDSELAKLRVLRQQRLDKDARKGRPPSRTAKISTPGPSIKSLLNKKRSAWSRHKQKFFEIYYAPRPYIKDPVTVQIKGRIGIEEDPRTFLRLAESIIDLETKQIKFDLKECSFIWPSAVTLLCSLKVWGEITRDRRFPFPRISSTASDTEAVNAYLNHCGFYDYVSRPPDPTSDMFDDQKVVKIIRETSKSNIKPRHQQIRKLLSKYSLLTLEQIEDFNDSVLPEIFLNVTEHGVNYFDAGWYTLAQYRPTTGVISLCIADNGVGIKNSLLTGPQRQALLKRFKMDADNDGDLIREAVKENISGAWTASDKKGFLLKSYEKGQRRGLGLTRIKDCCRRLQIPFIILSNKGCLMIDPTGKETVSNHEKRVFAGTLYHILIPAKMQRTASEG